DDDARQPARDNANVRALVHVAPGVARARLLRRALRLAPRALLHTPPRVPRGFGDRLTALLRCSTKVTDRGLDLLARAEQDVTRLLPRSPLRLALALLQRGLAFLHLRLQCIEARLLIRGVEQRIAEH